jgi:histo-blood group ABO system transferase
MNIGVIIIATNKYIEFVQPLLDSMKKYFLRKHNVEIFLFTDGNMSGVTLIPTEHQPWPWMTLGRYHLITQLNQYPKKDYYYYIDADMLITDFVDEEIFGKRVCAIHGKFKKKPGNFDRNPLSCAYVPEHIVTPYFCGGFQGGSNYLKDAEGLAHKIDTDEKNGVMAAWHDESHWNRFLLDNPPDVILPYHYCSQKEKDAKILIVKKDISAVRN